MKHQPLSQCTHISTSTIRKPTPSYKPVVHTDECTQCYNTSIVDDTADAVQQRWYRQGIYVCMTCHNGSCIDNDTTILGNNNQQNHLQHHYTVSKHPIYLHVRK